MQIILLLGATYAACGLLLSLIFHVAAIWGLHPAGDTVFFALHVGIFPLWFFVVFTARKMVNGVAERGQFWKMALANCPPWVRYMTMAFFAYAIANFLFFFITAPPHGKPPAGGPPPSVWRGFSGHWMAFYSAGFAVMLSAYRAGWGNLSRTCPKGHSVSWSDAYCPVCGSKLGTRAAS